MVYISKDVLTDG